MTDVVMFASTINNIDGEVAIPHQPTSPMPGILYNVNRFSISNFRKDDYPYTFITYPKIYVSWFNDLNTFYGFDDLAGITSVAGTFHLRKNNGLWGDFNGIISYIINGSPTQRTFASWSQVVYEIVRLVEL